MKNLSKKIGVGVVASSLVVGGAVSTGLVANAESVTGSQVEQNQIADMLNNFGDLEFVKYAKDKYNFKVFGYFFTDLSSDRNRMEWDIDEFLKDAKAKNIKNYQKIKDILEQDVKPEFNFTYGKDFVKYLYENGTDKGVKKVRIGDAIGIFIFKDKVDGGKDFYSDINKNINELEKLKSNNLQVDKDIEGRDHLEFPSNLLDDILEVL